MRHLAVDELHRSVTVPAIGSPAAVGRSPAEDEYLRYVRAHLRVGPILAAGIVWGLVLLFYFATMAPAKADPVRSTPSAQFTRGSCYQLAYDAGRMIAWARWEEGFSLEKTRSAPFRAGTPAWVIELVQDWITDAYQWQVTDEQVLQWASELGNVEDLPQATQLTRHETIAIWLRRIARQCEARRV